MSEFEPWLGNRNATDQQKNEYIRKLKAALIDASGYRVASGQYTGDGTASQIVACADSTMNITFIQIASTSGTGYNTQWFSSSAVPFVFIDGSPPVTDGFAVTALGTGSFTVGNSIYTNTAGVVYVYFVIGV